VDPRSDHQDDHRAEQLQGNQNFDDTIKTWLAMVLFPLPPASFVLLLAGFCRTSVNLYQDLSSAFFSDEEHVVAMAL
jgi:hypothetical protein